MEQDTLQQLQAKIDELTLKVEATYASVEKTRKYFLTILWVTALSILVPLLGLGFVLPSFLQSYLQALNG
jgi:hypothetical protein